MSVVMDPSFQFEGRFQNWLKMVKTAAEAKNYEREFHFKLAVDSWRQHAITNPSYGKPIPEKPPIPENAEIDEQKAREAFTAWVTHPEFVPGLEIGGDGPRKSYEIWKPIEVDDSVWKLSDDDAAQPVDQVSQIDISTPGRYNIAAGDKTQPGKVIEHPKYGNLRREIDDSPWGVVHSFVAADQAALDRWYRIKYETLMQKYQPRQAQNDTPSVPRESAASSLGGVKPASK